MSNNKMLKGVVIGAVVGGLLTLLDRDTRVSTVNKLKATQEKTSYYIKNPSSVLHNLGTSYQQMSSYLSQGIDSTLYTLSQLQDIIDAVSSEKEENDKPLLDSSE